MFHNILTSRESFISVTWCCFKKIVRLCSIFGTRCAIS